MTTANSKSVKLNLGGNDIIISPKVEDYIEKDGDQVNLDDDKEDDDTSNDDYQNSDKDDKSDEYKENDSLEVTLEDGNVVTGTINKDGDLVDETGKVILTKDNLTSSVSDDDEVEGITIADISKLSGITVTDQEGNEVAYENTVEGLAKREADIKKIGYIEGQKKALETFFSEYPEFESMFRYMKTYGNLDNYNNFVDFTKVALDSNNEAQLLDIIKKAEIAKGSSAERAERIANFSKVDNTLVADAQASLDYLANTQKSYHEAADREAAKNEAKLIEAEQNYYGVTVENNKIKSLNVKDSVYDKIVNEGKVGEFIIPKDGIKVKGKNNTTVTASREDLFKYIYVPVAEIDGQLLSQAQVDQYNKLNNTDELLKSFIMNFTGGNLDSLITAKAKSENVKKVRLAGSKTTSKSDTKTGSKVIVTLGR